jgi:hypothetical protein
MTTMMAWSLGCPVSSSSRLKTTVRNRSMLLKRPPPGSAGSESQPDAPRVTAICISLNRLSRPCLDPERRAQTATRFRVWGEISDSVRVPSESLGWDWVGCAVGSERWMVLIVSSITILFFFFSFRAFILYTRPPFAQPLDDHNDTLILRPLQLFNQNINLNPSNLLIDCESARASGQSTTN